MRDVVRFILMQRFLIYNFYNCYDAYIEILRLKICFKMRVKK